jgi:hypothetical protein
MFRFKAVLLLLGFAALVWSTGPSVLLQNSADPGVMIPLGGLGMPLGSGSSYPGTKST